MFVFPVGETLLKGLLFSTMVSYNDSPPDLFLECPLKNSACTRCFFRMINLGFSLRNLFHEQIYHIPPRPLKRRSAPPPLGIQFAFFSKYIRQLLLCILRLHFVHSHLGEIQVDGVNCRQYLFRKIANGNQEYQ